MSNGITGIFYTVDLLPPHREAGHSHAPAPPPPPLRLRMAGRRSLHLHTCSVCVTTLPRPAMLDHKEL